MLAPAALAAFAIFAAPPVGAEASEADSVSCAPSTEIAADKSRIVVQVLDANSSARIGGAKIFITGDAGGREFVSDELGGRQVDGVPPGAYVVLADAEVGNDQVYVQASPGHQCVVSFRLGEVVGDLVPGRAVVAEQLRAGGHPDLAGRGGEPK